jgi:hypothetical protein
MQKFTLLIGSLCALIVLGIGLSSCKDDEPFVKPNLSVNTDALEVNENAGTVEVEIVLDRPAPSNITVEYDLAGTAISPADYSIVGKEGEVEIAQGQTSAVIKLTIVNDAIYEGNETIEISLEDVSSTDVLITRDDETIITVKDDDPQITLSMATASVAANEDDGEVVLQVTLTGGAATQDIIVNYALTGTALDAVVGEEEQLPPQFWDYVIDVENAGQLVIPQGATSGEIVVTVFTDFQFEDDETIIVTLSGASNGVQITANNVTTITVEQQNGKVLALLFDDPANTDVDMDLFLWDTGPNPDQLLGLSVTTESQSIEALIIPSIIDAGSFGASYTYWGGTKEPMEFEVQFADFADGALEVEANREIYKESYNLVNVNPWNEAGGSDPTIAQTFEIVGGNIVNISDPITVNATGSRVATVALPNGIKKMKRHMPNALKKIR